MSPEQLTGGRTGTASDVFSCGATLAYALTGTPRLDSVDTDLRALVLRCLDPDPVIVEIRKRASETLNPPAALTTSPPAESDTRTLEIIIRGETTVYSLTTTVNGQAETATNVPLPWRRVVEIPALPRLSIWRIDYHQSPGRLEWQVFVDEHLVATGQSGSPSQDVRDFEEGAYQ